MTSAFLTSAITRYHRLIVFFLGEALEEILKDIKADKTRPSSVIKLNDFYKFRWIEALVLEENRRLFEKRLDCKTREELDATGGPDEEKHYHSGVSDSYNDEMWIPSTRRYPEMNSKFVEEMELPLLADDVDNEGVGENVAAQKSFLQREYFQLRASYDMAQLKVQEA